MDIDLCRFFNNATYPCYCLKDDGEFLMNPAAISKGAPFNDENFMRKIIKEENHGLSMDMAKQARRALMPAGILSMQELTIIPIDGGLLCLVTVPRDEATLNFSQQIREPLSEMFSMLPLIANGKDKRDMEILENMQAKCYRLLRIAANIESVSILEKGSFRTGLIDLNEMVDEMVESVNLLCRKEGVEVHFNHPSSMFIVSASKHLLEETFFNILRNSFQYSRDGNRIDINLKKVGRQALVTINDKGKGIKEEFLENVFNPYFSQDPYGDNPDKPGLGLGLTIAKLVTQNLGGTIGIHSVFGEGTSVSLSIPFASYDGEILESEPGIYVSNRYSPIYINLEGFARMPEL